MTKDDVLPYIIGLIKEDKRHKHYEHVTDLADKYATYYTGKNIEDELQRFTPREEQELFEQRKRITKHIVTSVAWNVSSVEAKVPRSNGITKLITYKEDDESKLKDLTGVLNKFWGDASWDRYMEVRWVELNDLDPNSFVIFEWGEYDNTKDLLQPYPFEVDSHQAIDFLYKNNILQYLTAGMPIKLKSVKNTEAKEKDGMQYIVYLANETIKFTQVYPDDNLLNATTQDKIVDYLGIIYLRIEDDIYIVEYPEPHNQGYVPAFRVGWKRDPKTKGSTYLAPWHAALPYLEKIVKANSELDLTMALHAFPQKVVAVPKCDNPKCLGGIITLPDGQKEKCPDCGGTGLMVHRSSQDVIAVPIPKDGQEQLKLEDMIKYIETPIDLPQFQDQYIDKMTERCIKVVYNSDIFTRSEIAETATEKKLDLDNVYDTLFPMSVKYSAIYKFGVKTIAKLIDRDKDLIVVHSFSKDFRFKSKDDYIAERKSAIDSQAPAEVLRYIDREIIRIDTADSPEDFAKHQIMTDLNPFEGKSQDEIQFIITSGNVPRQQIVLYSCYGFIYDDIQTAHPDFFNYPRDKMIELLNEYVDKYIEQIDKNKASTQQPQFE